MKQGCCQIPFKERNPGANAACDGSPWMEGEPEECCLPENSLYETPKPEIKEAFLNGNQPGMAIGLKKV